MKITNLRKVRYLDQNPLKSGRKQPKIRKISQDNSSIPTISTKASLKKRYQTNMTCCYPNFAKKNEKFAIL